MNIDPVHASRFTTGMTNHYATLLKSFTDDTARKLSGEHFAELAQLIQRLGLMPGPSNMEDGAYFGNSETGMIGIWEPRAQDGATAYQRSERLRPEWKFWADVPQIAPKSSKKRVILLGESVARGYLYDPAFNPARALAKMLECADLAEGVEIIDLARINLMFNAELIALAQKSLVLEPDVLVIFAGNNLSLSADVMRASQLFFPLILRQHGGIVGGKAYLSDLIEPQISSMTQALQALGIPVLFIIPEFNLKDWHTDYSVDVPWLAGHANERWFDCLAKSRNALDSNQIEEAETFARQMIELDQGTATAGFYVLAECKRRQGLREEERAYLEQAKDAHTFWLPQELSIPRIHGRVRESLRRNLARQGLSYVDVSELFAHWSGGELPDRRLFLDYCHLTSQGIHLAMAATAEHLMPLLGGRHISFDRLTHISIEPEAQIEAQTRFCAAIHCAHLGQPYDIVVHHCSEALSYSKEIAEVMLLYIDLGTRRAPVWMCESAARLKALDFPVVLAYLADLSIEKRLDRILFDAMADSLEEAGISAREKLAALRQAECGIAVGKSENLLKPYYSPSWTDYDWNMSPGFFRAHAPLSGFHFVCRKSQRVSVQLTCRLESTATQGGSCQISVNGTNIAAIEPDARWKTWHLTIPDDLVQEGINQIQITWPIRTISGDDALERAAKALEIGETPDLVPILGAIHALTASLMAEK